MFSTSTQRKFWIFDSEDLISILKDDTNNRYIERQKQKKKPITEEDDEMETEEDAEDDDGMVYLTSNEEKIMVKQYENYLKDFCRKFQPPMPKAVIGTSFHYFKRFYMYSSVMDYHPKEILVTCVYLATKVEEFNVSIMQFVANVKGDREKAMDIILNNELLLMQQLNYHLTIHNPFRPVEGFLIDIKTRCPDFVDPERLRPHIDDFLDNIYLTDAVMMFAPSQIALAAVFHAARKLKGNLDKYLRNILLGDEDDERVQRIMQTIRTVRVMYNGISTVNREEIAAIEKKLSICRNQENNPDSQHYKMREILEDDEERVSRQITEAQERKKEERELGAKRFS